MYMDIHQYDGERVMSKRAESQRETIENRQLEQAGWLHEQNIPVEDTVIQKTWLFNQITIRKCAGCCKELVLKWVGTATLSKSNLRLEAVLRLQLLDSHNELLKSRKLFLRIHSKFTIVDVTFHFTNFRNYFKGLKEKGK
jgi:hypothetical protein